MKTFIRISSLAIVATMMYFTDFSVQPTNMTIGLEFVSEAQAVLGVRRRSARRGAAVGYTAGAEAAHSADAAAAAQAAPPPPAPAPAPAAPVYGPLPLGTIVSVLPSGCAPVTTAGVQYQHCGDNYLSLIHI